MQNTAQNIDFPELSRPQKREDRMHDLITDALNPIALIIKNDSQRHAGHAAMHAPGASKGESHYFVEVVSDRFKDVPKVQRHQMVYEALKPEFDGGMHALQIKTMTVDEL